MRSQVRPSSIFHAQHAWTIFSHLQYSDSDCISRHHSHCALASTLKGPTLTLSVLDTFQPLLTVGIMLCQ